MTLHTASYTQARNAYAAARKAGLDHKSLTYVQTEADAEGRRRWTWEVPADPVKFCTSATEAEAVVAAVAVATGAVVTVDAPVEVLDAAPLSYKQLQSYDRSVVLSPFKFVHGWLDANGAKATRREAIQYLVQAGVNYSTARTQYQVWFKRQKAA